VQLSLTRFTPQDLAALPSDSHPLGDTLIYKIAVYENRTFASIIPKPYQTHRKTPLMIQHPSGSGGFLN
jgi:hypothetical protein